MSRIFFWKNKRIYHEALQGGPSYEASTIQQQKPLTATTLYSSFCYLCKTRKRQPKVSESSNYVD